MEKFELRRLIPADERAFLDAILAWDKNPSFQFVGGYSEGMRFTDFLEVLRKREAGEDLPDGHVPDTALFGFADGRLVGRLSIRHRLNDHLLRVGGHIGYGVLPHERRKGYAKLMLKLSLPVAKELGLKRVLVTCDEGNSGSIKTIEANGGVLENVLEVEAGKPAKRRYWIEVSQS